MQVFDAGRAWFDRVVFSPDGSRVAAADDRWSAVWAFDRAGDEPRWMKDQSASALCFYPDANWLLATTGYRTVRLDWAGREAEELGGPIEKVEQFAPLSDGRLATRHCGDSGYEDYRPRVRTWRAGPDGVPELESELILSENDDPRSPWLLWPDGSRVARLDRSERSGRANHVVVLSVPELRELGTFATKDWHFRSTVVSPDGRRVVVLDGVGLVVRTEPDWETAHRVKNTGKKHFTGVAFHPSGRYVAATGNDTTVKLYDTTSWQVAKTYTWEIGRMRSVAFSPDGTLAAAGSDTGKVVVWDIDV